MSWQDYVDSHLCLASPQGFDRAAIVGPQGGVWAHSPGFDISQEEQFAIAKAFENKDTAQANGIRLNGVKYVVTRTDESYIYGRQSQDGCVLTKTKAQGQGILVGCYNHPKTVQDCMVTMERVAGHLNK